MAEEIKQILSGLEIEQLKDLVEMYGIDCSGCERKEEYIAAILSSLKVKADDLRSVLGTGPKMYTGSGSDSMPKFADAEQLLRETKNKFESGDYLNTIDKATEAIDLGSKALNAFYGIGLSYAIRSSENMMSTVKDAGIDTTPLEQVLGQAKQSFENQEYEGAGKIIGQIRDAMSDLYKQHVQKVNELIEVTQSLLDDAKKMGSDISEAETILQNARDMMASNSLPTALESLKQSEKLAKTAKENRVKEISDIITKAGEAIEEARYLNAPVAEAESLLENARNAFDSEDYILALENANKASEAANAAREDQIQRVLKVQEKIKPTQAAVVESEVKIITEPSETFEAEEELISEEEETFEEIAEPKPTETIKVCPKCGGEPTYVEQYQRYYCYTCSEYIEPKEKTIEEKIEEVAKPKPAKVTKVCPTCGGEPTYVEQYKRYYCYTCSEYIEPVEKGVEEKPKPAKVTKVCPTCGGEPTYVEQYKRYYCYTCSEYVEPVEKKSSAKTCPTCGGEPTYVDQYKRYYCYTCNKYL